MTGTSQYIDQVRDFDQFFTNKYNQLLNEAQSITKHYDYSSDIVNDTYLKVRRRIWLSGYTGTNFHSFCWRSIQNEWFVLTNRRKIRTFIDIDHEDHYGERMEAEEQLLVEHEWNVMQEMYYQRIERIVMILFNFIETHYSERDSYLFKTYFLCGDTYKELSRRTGYSQTTISNVIKPMKKVLKTEFETFLKSKI